MDGKEVFPLRYAPVEGCDFFDFILWWLESYEEHRLESILGVLRLRA